MDITELKNKQLEKRAIDIKLGDTVILENDELYRVSYIRYNYKDKEISNVYFTSASRGMNFRYLNSPPKAKLLIIPKPPATEYEEINYV
jgi:hypothetical protein